MKNDEMLSQDQIDALLEGNQETLNNITASNVTVVSETIKNQSDLPGQESFGRDIKSDASRTDSQSVHVQHAKFASLEQPDFTMSESNNLSMLLDIPLQITVELGRTQRTVQEILALTAGSVIELDKLAGEPVDVLVNSRLIAKGEVVVIEENFGVRLTDIVSQNDRLNKLR